MKKLLTILLASMLLLGTAACSGTGAGKTEQSTYPMTVTDAVGNTVTLEAEPMKIVSLAPSATEIIYAVNAGGKLVGRTNWCDYPAEAASVEDIGSAYSGINIERIVEMGADLVIATKSYGYSPDAVSSLGSVGIPVFALADGSADDIYASIEQVGTLLNVTADAKSLVESLQSDLTALREKCAATTSRKLFIDFGGFYSASKVDFLGGLMDVINVENIAGDFDYTYPQLSAEAIIEANPDVYVNTAMSADAFEQPDGFSEISAFKNNEAYFINYDDPRVGTITRMGPRFVEGLKILAKFAHPELEF